MAPFLRGSRYPLMTGEQISWLLRDEFSTDLAAGSVNGTAAEPGPGTRTVRDVESFICIGDYLFADEFTTPQSAPITSPRTLQPSKGTATIRDTESLISIV